MQKLMKAVRLSLIYGAALLLAGSYPLNAMAEAVDTPSTSSTTVPAEATPTDSASTTTPLLALSTPTTDTTSLAPSDAAAPSSDTPTQPKETYTYNPDTEHWDSNIWRYNATTGMYERIPQTTETLQPSLLAAPSSLIASPAVGTSDQAVSQPSSTTISDTTKNALTNAINSGALTGDATVKDNTQAGSATTGDALAASTIINNVNSTVTNTSNQKAATFVSDVMGDVSGDILLQPTLLKAMLEAGAQTPSTNNTTVTTTNQLTNNVTLDATSGDAAVTGNTQAGSATTGDATTIANILNIVNSMVSANQSFVGTINIYGNLDGDILIAPDFIPQMLANNGTTDTSASSTTVSSQDTQSIVNNIALAAQTGSAAVTDNTTAGSATTGDAMTNIVLFNLTGHDIIASNSLLVFVNVLGKWVGVIVDAPVGATAAAIGNGVSTNTTVSPDLIINATTDTQITNNVTLTSQSGNALVSNNTLAGNATTGNATASANIGNIVGTQMGLSGWFGILFINVFGTWTGSFGIDTAAGNHTAATGGGAAIAGEQKNGQPMRVIEFIPHASTKPKNASGSSVTLVGSDGNGGYTATNAGDQPTVKLASATHPGAIESPEAYVVSQTLEPVGLHPALYIPWLAGATFLIGISLVGASTLSDMRKRGMGPK